MIKFKRPPNLIIGNPEDPYLHRWFLFPKNRFFNIYLHKFFKSDDNRALHDHPWLFNVSILLSGSYIEQKPAKKDLWPIDLTRKEVIRRRFIPYIRIGRAPHAVKLYELEKYKNESGQIVTRLVCKPILTIFITGPRVREWGFYCPKGFKPWKEYTKNETPGVSEIGVGCDD